MIAFGESFRAPLEQALGEKVRDGAQFIAQVAEKGSGIVAFSGWTGRDVEIHVAGTGSWLTRRLIETCWLYAFTTMGCRRVTCTIAGQNTKSRRLAERFGFVHEGTLRHALRGDDLLVYGLLKEDGKHVRRIEQATSGPGPGADDSASGAVQPRRAHWPIRVVHLRERPERLDEHQHLAVAADAAACGPAVSLGRAGF